MIKWAIAAIVAEVARAHGGIEDGPGARFVVVLPAADGFSVG